MATAMERKFTGLRKRLDQLGYRQALGVESLPLVERIFNDLLHTTESLRNAKLQLAKNKEQKGLWEKHIEPYQQDNSRLMQENINLHQQIMKMKESNETKVKESKAFIRRLEHENADLKFLNNQYMQRLIMQEKESQAKSERIMTLQEKNSQAVIQTPGGRKRQLPYRRQRMDIDAVLEPSASSKRLPPPVVPPPDSTVVNLLKVADERMTSLQTSLKKCEDEKGQLQGTVQDMKKQVDRREEEINRLSSQLRGGRPPEALAMEGKVETNERMVAHLNIQVDFLQQANQKLESDLMDSEKIQEELRLKVDDLSSKNSRICTELQEIGGLVKEMENERQKNETSLKSEIDNLLQQCANLHQTIQEYEQKKDENTKAQQELFSENRKMAELLATSEVDAEQAAEVIEQLSRENRQLRKMNHQITTAKDSSGSVDGSVDIQKLIKERNELKNVVENFETELMQIRQDAMTLKQDRDNIQLLYSQVNEELNKYRHEPGQSSQPSSQSNAGVNFGRLSRVERERDDAKLEVKQLTLECNSLKERLRIMKEGKEKEEMTEEIEIDKLHLQIENLTKEHSNLKEHSESLRRVVDSLEKELEQSTTALSTCQDENKALCKKLKTIEGTLGALQRTKEEENRGIRQQLAQSEVTSAEVVQLKSHISHLEDDVRRKGEKIDELSNALKTIDQEFDHLRSECDNKDEELCEMKKELKNKMDDINRLDSESVVLKAYKMDTQSQLVAKEKEISSLKQQLAVVHSDLEKEKRVKSNLETRVGQLKQDVVAMTTECHTTHEELRKAVAEKERLNVKEEELTQRILKYEEQLAIKEQERESMLESYQALTREAERLDSNIQHAKSQNTSLDIEMNSLIQEKCHLEELCQQQADEINQHLMTLQSYELQLSNLTHAMSKMEQTIRQEQEEKRALLIDLSTVRDLCVQLDQTKDSLTRQLASLSVNNEQKQTELTDAISERDLLKQEIIKEQSKIENLEVLLSNERRKDYHSQLTTEEKDKELHHLRQQLTRLENDNLIQRNQMKKLQGEHLVKMEELERIRAEQTSLKLQKHDSDQKLMKLRESLVSSSKPLRLSQSSPSHVTQSPSHDQSSTSSSESKVDDVISRDEEELKSESAKLVEELLSKSNPELNRTSY